MCDSRKYLYSPHGRSLEIPSGRGVLKAKLLQEKYEAKLEFCWGVRGCKTKNLLWGEHGYFLALHVNYFLMASISTDQSKCENSERWSCQVQCWLSAIDNSSPHIPYNNILISQVQWKPSKRCQKVVTSNQKLNRVTMVLHTQL